MPFERTLLIVDDEPELAELWGAAMRAHGWSCRTATSPSAVSRVLAEGFRPAVLVVDWTLGGHTGAEVIGAVRAAAPAAEVILCSGDETRIPPEVRASARAILGKPFRLARLAELLAPLGQ